MECWEAPRPLRWSPLCTGSTPPDRDKKMQSTWRQTMMYPKRKCSDERHSVDWIKEPKAETNVVFSSHLLAHLPPNWILSGSPNPCDSFYLLTELLAKGQKSQLQDKSSSICKVPSLSLKQETRIIQMRLFDQALQYYKRHFNYCAWLAGLPPVIPGPPEPPVLWSGGEIKWWEMKSNCQLLKQGHHPSRQWCWVSVSSTAGRRERKQKQEKWEGWRGRKNHLHSEDFKCYKRGPLTNFL